MGSSGSIIVIIIVIIIIISSKCKVGAEPSPRTVHLTQHRIIPQHALL